MLRCFIFFRNSRSTHEQPIMQTPPPSQRKFMSGPRRVASVPVRLAGSPSSRPSTARPSPSPSASTEYGSGGGSVQNNIDLLFAHSSARVVSFNSASGLGGQLLPWTSPTERTIASGTCCVAQWCHPSSWVLCEVLGN